MQFYTCIMDLNKRKFDQQNVSVGYILGMDIINLGYFTIIDTLC